MQKTLIAATCLAAGLLLGSAVADAKTCKSEFVVGHGHRHVSAGLARASAVRAWRTWAEIKYGWRYKNWNRSAEKRFDCHSPPGGPGLMECTATARPCKP